MAVCIVKMNYTDAQLHARWQIAYVYAFSQADAYRDIGEYNKSFELEHIASEFGEWFKRRFQYDLGSLRRAFIDYRSEKVSHA